MEETGVSAQNQVTENFLTCLADHALQSAPSFSKLCVGSKVQSIERDKGIDKSPNQVTRGPQTPNATPQHHYHV